MFSAFMISSDNLARRAGRTTPGLGSMSTDTIPSIATTGEHIHHPRRANRSITNSPRNSHRPTASRASTRPDASANGNRRPRNETGPRASRPTENVETHLEVLRTSASSSC